MPIHSRFARSSNLFGHHRCRQGINRNLADWGRHCPYGPCRSKAIHFGHLQIHQNSIKAAGLKLFKRFHPIGRKAYLMPDDGQQSARYITICLDVINHKNTKLMKGMWGVQADPCSLRGSRHFGQENWNLKPEKGTATRRTFAADLTAHLLHKT